MSRWWSCSEVLSKGPNPLFAGQSQVEEPFEVDGSGPVRPPHVVLHDAPIRHSARSSGHPRQGPFNHGPVLLINALKLGILSSNPVFTPEPVVRLDDKFSAGLSCGAPVS